MVVGSFGRAGAASELGISPRYPLCPTSLEMSWSIRETVSRLSTRTKTKNQDTPLSVNVSEAATPNTHPLETPKVALASQLPLELWAEVFEFIGYGDVVRLATACKYFRFCAHDFIFGSVCFVFKIPDADGHSWIGYKHSKHGKNMREKLSFFSLASVAARVHSLTIKKETSFTNGEDLIDDIFHALPLFNSLKHLVLENVVFKPQRCTVLQSLHLLISVSTRSCNREGSITGSLRAIRVNVDDGLFTGGNPAWNFLLHPEHVQHLTVISAVPFTPSKPLSRISSLDIDPSRVPFSQWIPFVTSCTALQLLTVRDIKKTYKGPLHIFTQYEESLPKLRSYSGPYTRILAFTTESLRHAYLYQDKEPERYINKTELCGILQRLSELAPCLETLKLDLSLDLPSILESLRFESLRHLEITFGLWVNGPPYIRVRLTLTSI